MSSKRSNPSHQIPLAGGPGPNHPTLLQKCRKRRREDMGREDHNPTPNSDQLGRSKNKAEKQQFVPIFSTTDSWTILTHLLGESN